MPKTALAQHQPAAQRHERSGSVRAFVGLPTSVDEATRSFDIVITTETAVRRWIPDPRQGPITDDMDCSYIEVDEVLVAAGVDLSRAARMPLIDCHDTYSGIEKILGKIDDVRVEGQAVVGRASLSRKHAELLPDIIDGYYGNISAGYDYDLRNDTELVERVDMVPELRVLRWLLTEGSLVPVGADPNSFIRSAYAPQPTPPKKRSAEKTQERSMDIEEVLAAAEAAVTAAEEAVVAVEAAVAEGGETVSEEITERARGLRGKLRAEEEDLADKKPDPEAAAEAARKRADGDEDEELTAEEKKDVEDVRSIARNYGQSELVSDMRSLGAKPAMIRKALVKAIADGGASTVDKTAPVVAKPAARSALADFNPSAIMAARNKR
jgi:hypothetical protein